MGAFYLRPARISPYSGDEGGNNEDHGDNEDDNERSRRLHS